MLATDYTNGLALTAIKLIFDYLPRAYENGSKDGEAREIMANASTIAGRAFATAFLGICTQWHINLVRSSTCLMVLQMHS